MEEDGMDGRGLQRFFLEVLNLYSQRLIYDITKL